MEEEIPYSSVFFIKSEEEKSKDAGQNAEQPVYVEVKKNYAQSNPATVNQCLPGHQRYRYAVVVLGLLTAVFLSALGAVLVYYGNYVSESNSLQARLYSEMSQLQQEKKSLMMERDHLNQTLEVIFGFSVFPVDQLCPKLDNATQERKCTEHCKTGWVYYQSSCYLFIYQNSPWKTWGQSMTDCVEREAHLVTIDKIKEQAFITNYTTFYYDVWHGYWIGLSKSQNNWQWVNGSTLIGGYWISGPGVIIVHYQFLGGLRPPGVGIVLGVVC